MPSRPDRLVLVLGTETGVGKTWTTAGVVRCLVDDGRAARARKPVQSFAPADAEAAATDAHVLAGAGGEEPEDVCPPHRWYETALAPPMPPPCWAAPPSAWPTWSTS